MKQKSQGVRFSSPYQPVYLLAREAKAVVWSRTLLVDLVTANHADDADFFSELDVGCWALSCLLAKTFGVERLLLSALRSASLSFECRIVPETRCSYETFNVRIDGCHFTYRRDYIHCCSEEDGLQRNRQRSESMLLRYQGRQIRMQVYAQDIRQMLLRLEVRQGHHRR